MQKELKDDLLNAMKDDPTIGIYAKKYMHNQLINESYNSLFIKDNNTWLLRNSVYRDRHTIIFNNGNIDDIINSILAI